MSVAEEFLAKVQDVYKTGAATEHSYRSAIEFLFNSLDEDVTPLNEPKRVQCGAPDFIIQRGEIAIGHVEAKDIGLDLRAMKGVNKAQQERYLKALPNLIYTNCLDFDFYRDGERVASVTIADYLMGIQPKPDQFEALEHLICDFLAQRPQTITSTRTLARMMAGKAVLIKDVLTNALKEDGALSTDLTQQYQAFKKHLIHDITPEDFADIYAETIAYGMFAARLHDDTVDSFSRQEALELLPKSNPFLRNLFSYIAGPNLDDRIKWIIDDLAAVFQACDLHGLMEDFGRLTGRNDPFLHFYEDFLKEYNPAKRKSRGVWYTPEPVVNFIVRAVDDVLQKEFGLAEGLADTSKVTIDWETGERSRNGAPVTIKKDVHKVQILDPATGTGTFLAEVIKQVAPRIKGVAEGMWSSYVEKDLIPRLHGFELLMASYAMCHMKLDMILTDLGYKPTKSPPRLSVFLTNSLEEGEAANQTLPFAQWLSNEVREANTIKRDMPIMCVIGNPPYSGESANKGEWIMNLMEAYKREPGGVERLKERNPKWINDDYMKFIRFSEHMIEKNGEGVLGFITNHGYLDNPTFRGVRWHLLKTFDKIYVLDLHGNSKKKEVAPDGAADKNVFDIMQGVAIVVAVKTTPTAKTNKRKNGADVPLAKVFHADLWGSRSAKYEALWAGSLESIDWEELENRAPQYAFARRDYGLEEVYRAGFGVQEMMPVNGTGVITKRDSLNIQSTKDGVENVIDDFLSLSESEIRQEYQLPPDVRDWRYEWAKQDIIENRETARIERILYRPFDIRWIYYSGRARGLVGWPVELIMRHFVFAENFGLIFSRQAAREDAPPINVLVSRHIFDNRGVYSNKGISQAAPLYLHPAEGELDQTPRVNLDPNLWKTLQVIVSNDNFERGGQRQAA